MKVRLLGAHNAESLDTKLVSILIDGVLALDAGGLTSGLTLAQQAALKAVLLTHRHYDHIRDIAMLGLNTLERGTTAIYAPADVLDALVSHFLDGAIYPRLTERPSPDRPSLRLCPLEPLKEEMVEGYGVLPVPVSHGVPAVGYQVTSADGRALFYTGDTGPGLARCWEAVNPQLLIIETTLPDRFEEAALASRHLTPRHLGEELARFREMKGYLPRVILVHMSPYLDEEIRGEVEGVGRKLGVPIALGSAGMEVEIRSCNMIE